MKPDRDTKASAKTLMREIEVYRSHCLYVEAIKRAEELADLIRSSRRIKNKAENLSAIDKKCGEIRKEAEAFDAFGTSIFLTTADRKRIKDVIASGCKEGSEEAVYESAIAMLVFGQFDEAIGEFKKMIGSDRFRVAAAKSIIRSHIAKSSIAGAVAQYDKWQASRNFPSSQLENVRHFLSSILRKKGVSLSLQKPREPEEIPIVIPEPEVPDQEIPDLLSISLPYRNRSDTKKEALLDIHFQRGKTINIIVPRDLAGLIDYLQPGMTLKDVQINSTDFIYIETCVVYGKSLLRVGKNQGDYTVTLKLS